MHIGTTSVLLLCSYLKIDLSKLQGKISYTMGMDNWEVGMLKIFAGENGKKHLLSTREKNLVWIAKLPKLFQCFYTRQTRNAAKTKHKGRPFVVLIWYDTYALPRKSQKKLQKKKSGFITNLIILEVQPLQYHATESSSKDKRNMATDTAHVNIYAWFSKVLNTNKKINKWSVLYILRFSTTIKKPQTTKQYHITFIVYILISPQLFKNMFPYIIRTYVFLYVLNTSVTHTGPTCKSY